MRRPPRPTLFPYTTLFRSNAQELRHLPAYQDPTEIRASARCLPRDRQDTGESRARRDELQQAMGRSEEHTSELQSLTNLVCRLLLEKKKQAYSRTLGDPGN